MDDFFVNSSINLKNSQQRLIDNINAYYDIGFPDELKDTQILNNIQNKLSNKAQDYFP